MQNSSVFKTTYQFQYNFVPILVFKQKLEYFAIYIDTKEYQFSIHFLLCIFSQLMKLNSIATFWSNVSKNTENFWRKFVSAFVLLMMLVSLRSLKLMEFSSPFFFFFLKTRNTDFSNPVARRMGQHNTLKDKHTGEELFIFTKPINRQ